MYRLTESEVVVFQTLFGCVKRHLDKNPPEGFFINCKTKYNTHTYAYQSGMVINDLLNNRDISRWEYSTFVGQLNKFWGYDYPHRVNDHRLKRLEQTLGDFFIADKNITFDLIPAKNMLTLIGLTCKDAVLLRYMDGRKKLATSNELLRAIGRVFLEFI
jgi:hypothetical protein